MRKLITGLSYPPRENAIFVSIDFCQIFDIIRNIDEKIPPPRQRMLELLNQYMHRIHKEFHAVMPM